MVDLMMMDVIRFDELNVIGRETGLGKAVLEPIKLESGFESCVNNRVNNKMFRGERIYNIYQ